MWRKAVRLSCLLIAGATACTGTAGNQAGDSPADDEQDSDDSDIVGAWQPEPCDKTAAAFAGARIWQITDSQYANSVRDVLGLTLAGSDAEISGAASSTGEARNHADGGGDFTDMLAQNYQATAIKLARLASAPAKMTTLLGSATPSEEQLRKFVTTRIARLWRRPVSEDETRDLLALYNSGTDPADGGHANALSLLIQATLQAPSFLFRSEVGSHAKSTGATISLTPYELAAAVSFMFTDSVPDDSMWHKAVDGTITKPDVLAAEVDRLIALPSVQANLTRHVSSWLWMERIGSRQKDTKLFPEYTPTLQKALYASGYAFLADIVQNGRLSDLFTSTKVFVNKEMSAVYGIAGGTESMSAVESTLPERSVGLLGQPSLLAATNKRPGLADPVHHGLFILDDLLCGGDVGAIPDAPADAFEKAAKMVGNERELADMRAAVGACRGCHAHFDPFGLTRLAYDAIGRFDATRYVAVNASVTPAAYQWTTTAMPLDTSSTVSQEVGADISGPLADTAALAAMLSSPGPMRRVAHCAGQNLAARVLGHDDLRTSCALRKVNDAFAKGGDFLSFFKSLATSPAFAIRSSQDEQGQP